MDSKVVEYIETIEDENNREIYRNLINYTLEKYPDLKLEFKWNQPMFTINDSFVISYTKAAKHISIAAEDDALNQFDEQREKLGYDRTKKMYKIGFNQEIDYDFISSIVEFQIELKRDCEKFWI